MPVQVPNTQPIEIREAQIQDVPLILDFIRELAEYEKLLHQVEASQELLQEALFGARPYAHVLLAYYGSEPAGFAFYYFNFSTFLGRPGLYLDDIFVRPAYRARGIGKLFFERLARIAQERNCGRFEWIVLNWNKRAIDFYESMGARPLSEWTVYRLTGDAIQSVALAEQPQLKPAA